MCSNYTPATALQLKEYFGVAEPDSAYRAEAYPGHMAPIIRRRAPDASPGDRACITAMFGMVPHWAEPKLARYTYNARTETVAIKPSFRMAWANAQFCIIPAASIFEPNYESGKAVRYEIGAASGEPLGIAGLWERKPGEDGAPPLYSFTMLTINADTHELMRRFHKPNDEKRMVVILAPDQYDDWLNCSTNDAAGFLNQYPAKLLATTPRPKTRL